MRRHAVGLLAAAAFGLVVTQAPAADLPRKAPAPAYVPPAPRPPPITWTGCYIGANIGAIRDRSDATFNGVDFGRDHWGFAGGGQIGCDYQFAGGWVIGIRNMFDGTSLSRSRTFVDQFGNTGTVDFHNRWFDTLTGRIGYAVYPSWLLYGQGGVAWAKNSADVTLNGFDLGSFDRTRTGWTAGIGTEWMFARGWSVFLEGNWMDFGKNDHTVFGGACPVGGCFFNTHAQAGTALVGVNYRFGWGKAPYY